MLNCSGYIISTNDKSFWKIGPLIKTREAMCFAYKSCHSLMPVTRGNLNIRTRNFSTHMKLLFLADSQIVCNILTCIRHQLWIAKELNCWQILALAMWARSCRLFTCMSHLRGWDHTGLKHCMLKGFLIPAPALHSII